MGWAGWFAAHGYLAVGGILFLSALGLPMPTVLALILAGAAMHSGTLAPLMVLLVAVAAENLGATALYVGGRATGWWLLARLCRVSMDPETCIFRSAEFFYRRGARTLLFSRFVPGLASMAPPLAGSLNMRAFRFWRYDVAGALLHVAAWLSVGYFLSPFIRRITDTLAVVGHVALGFVAPDPSRPIVIADVRSHGYYDPGMQRIKNSIRVEPNRLLFELDALRETIAAECDIYVYCSCLRDATSGASPTR